MDSGRIVFLVLISLAAAYLYYQSITTQRSLTRVLAQKLALAWAALSRLIVRHRFLVGLAIICVCQYFLSSLKPLPYASGELLFFLPSITSGFKLDFPLMAEIFLDIPAAVNTLIDYLLLLAGCFLVVSAFPLAGPLPDHGPEKPAETASFSARRLVLLGSALLALNFILLWQLHNLSDAPGLVGIWLASVAGFIFIALRLDARHGVFNGPSIQRLDAVWLCVLFLFGLLVGMYRLQSLPNQLMPDEDSFWNMASGIASGAVHPGFFDYGVYTYPIASSFGQALVLQVFGISLWSWRFSSLLAGLLTIFPLYLLARELFNRQVAIVSCVVMVTTEYFLAFSRLGYNNSQALFPVTLALYFVAMGIRRGSLLYFCLAGCASGLGFYTYTAARSAVVIVALFMLTVLLQNRGAFRSSLKALAMLGLGCYLVASPLLVYGSVRNSESMSLKLKESLFFNTNFAYYPHDEILSDPGTIVSADGNFFFNPRIYTALITRGLLRTFLSFNVSTMVKEHFISAPLAGLVGAAFFTLGLVISLAGYREWRHYLLLYWFGTNVLLLSTLDTFPPRHQHMVSVIPLLALWTALGLTTVLNGFLQTFPRIKPLALPLALLATSGLCLAGLYSYFVRMPEKYPPPADQVMAWTGLYANNENILAVAADADPQKPDITWINDPGSQVSFQTIPVTALAAQRDTRTIVFYPPELRTQVEDILRSAWPGTLASRTFYDRDGAIILLGAANTPTDFGPAPGLTAALRDSYARPGAWLILLVALALVFVWRFRGEWLERAPAPLLEAYAWLTREPAPG